MNTCLRQPNIYTKTDINRVSHFLPTSALTNYIDKISIVESTSDHKLPLSYVDHLLPNDNCIMEVLIKGSFKFKNVNQKYWEHSSTITIKSISDVGSCIKSNGIEWKLIRVKYKPLGKHHFTVTDDLETNVNKNVHQNRMEKTASLLEELAYFSDYSDIINTVTQFHVQSQKTFAPPAILVHLVSLIKHRKGVGSLNYFCSKAGISERHCRRLFNKYLGLSAKKYARIIRLKAISKDVEKQKIPNLQDIIFNYGYYDHAHFIHDFKNIMNMTPKSYYSRIHPFEWDKE